MKKVYDKINIDLYIIAVAFGKNYSNNVYARILISDNIAVRRNFTTA